MKAGTAHKMVLNMISTASMVKLGKVYGNLMVDFHASNFKLKERAKRVVSLATGASREEAEEALRSSSGSVKVAIMILLTGTSVETSLELLQASGGFLRLALNPYWGKSNEKTD